jgi:hypothetical protein
MSKPITVRRHPRLSYLDRPTLGRSAYDVKCTHFVSRLCGAQNRQKQSEYLASRNESFRMPRRKLLKSLGALNQHFAGSFVFKGLTAISFRRFQHTASPGRQAD